MRGRRPVGPEYADKLDGSNIAKERVKVILETMAGRCRLKEACERLGISEQRFHQLREEMMAAAVKALEPGHAGRPAHTPTPAEEQVVALEQQLADKEAELIATKARAEIAVIMPELNHPASSSAGGESGPKKKNAIASAETPTPWQEEEHVKRLHELCHPHDPPVTRRGHARQRLTRERESILRGNIVELTRWTANLGFSLPETADLLHLSPRTLRSWHADFDFHAATPHIHLLGRPTLRSSLEVRTAVIDVLKELGPATSIATLRECFPWMPRVELEDLRNRYRRVWQRRYHTAPYTLHWQRIGAVWAIDFSETPCLIDGIYPYLLAVRDLASHQQLLWLPVTNMTAEVATEALQMLVTIHGAPLVLKADNGSAFIADATKQFLLPFGVNLLFSPPQTPRYNGAIEAGIGSLKTRTERYATRDGHPGYWTSDDAAAAQTEANATARPQGELGPTPNELWQTRHLITPLERQLFREAVQKQREKLNLKDDLSDKEDRRMQREAIRRALVEHGILLFSRRRIHLPIPSQKAANIM